MRNALHYVRDLFVVAVLIAVTAWAVLLATSGPAAAQDLAAWQPVAAAPDPLMPVAPLSMAEIPCATADECVTPSEVALYLHSHERVAALFACSEVRAGGRICLHPYWVPDHLVSAETIQRE